MHVCLPETKSPLSKRFTASLKFSKVLHCRDEAPSFCTYFSSMFYQGWINKKTGYVLTSSASQTLQKRFKDHVSLQIFTEICFAWHVVSRLIMCATFRGRNYVFSSSAYRCSIWLMPSTLIDPPYRTDTTNTFSEDSDTRNKNVLRIGEKMPTFLALCETVNLKQSRATEQMCPLLST